MGRAEFDRLTTAEALSRLEQMRGFLVSFRRLTDNVRPRTAPAELKAIGNTDLEMQSIGFYNIPLAIEGVILKQAYQLAQSRYELARLKSERGPTGAEELARATAAYRAATAAWQTFWDTKRPSD